MNDVSCSAVIDCDLYVGEGESEKSGDIDVMKAVGVNGFGVSKC